MKYLSSLLFAVAMLVSCNSVSISDNETHAIFEKNSDGFWSVSIDNPEGINATSIVPAAIVYYTNDVATKYTSSYQSVKKKGASVVADASIEIGASTFTISDMWNIKEGSLMLSRKVSVTGTSDGDGFYSSFSLDLPGQLTWENTKPIISGVIYGEPHTTTTSKGGSKYIDAGFFSIREDCLSAPAVTMVAENNRWIMLADPSPDGNTTWDEVSLNSDVAINESIRLGAFEIRDNDGQVIMSFNYPCTSEEFRGRSFGGAQATTNTGSVVKYRLHPVNEGFEQTYELAICTAQASSFNQAQQDSWRTTWNYLQPKVSAVDVELVKQDLLNHLSDRVLMFDGRAGVPFVIDAQSGKPGSFRPKSNAFRMGSNYPELQADLNWAKQMGIDIDPSAAELDIWPYAVFGFCGKHMEIAQQFYREADRDNTERGAKLRSQADAIMKTFIDEFPLNPPKGEGISIRSGRVGNIHGGNAFAIRPFGEDLSTLLDLVQQEKAQGREHPEWIDYCRSFADWLLTYRHSDGSFPADWGTDGAVSADSGSKSYSVVSMYAKLGQITGEKKYADAALAAAEYIWENYGLKDVYLGATGGVDVADKESGMLSMDAFLTLYEINGDKKWLERACAAAAYTESWIWIWSVPMPQGADPAELGWKPGVNTIGVNGIGSNDVGGVDQYLDWAVPHYAKLYKYTGDSHYKDVAYILLHGTKAMLAITGRTYDLAGAGWQQEHWRMSQTRGIGAHRTWLPWISINHLHGITALEDFDEDLYKELSIIIS